MRLKKIFRIFCVIQVAFYACMLSSCTSNKKVVGTICYNDTYKLCTLVACDCCNDCSSNILFITGADTLQLCGTVRDTGISCGNKKSKTMLTCDTIIQVRKNAILLCKGEECEELNCSPFVNNKQYEIVGCFLPVGKDERYANFKVLKFTETVKK